MPAKNLIGERYGRLLVLDTAEPNKWGHLYWKCICDCGTLARVQGSALRSGQQRSCGCLHRESASKTSISIRTKHGRSGSAEYTAWCHMKQRCYDTNSPRYEDWGGRGIAVCERWLHSFENFLADMGPKPGNHYQLDRIDNQGNYTPDNCRWATPSENSNNRG